MQLKGYTKTSGSSAVSKFGFIKYRTTVYDMNGKKIFWSIKNSVEILK